MISQYVDIRKCVKTERKHLQYTQDNYDFMTNSVRTQFYAKSITKVLKKMDLNTTTVVDVGTGANATMSLIAIENGAKDILAIEIDYSAFQCAQRVFSKQMRVTSKTTNKIYFEDDHVKVCLVYANVMEYDFPDAVKSNVVLIHELFDDIASREDAIEIISHIQCALTSRTRQILSIPTFAYTMARPIRLPKEIDEKMSGILPPSNTNIHLDNLVPDDWFVEDAQIVEELDFTTNPCNVSNYRANFAESDLVALYLRIVCEDEIYEVAEGDPWRHIIIPTNCDLTSVGLRRNDDKSYNININDSIRCMTEEDEIAIASSKFKKVREDPWGMLNCR